MANAFAAAEAGIPMSASTICGDDFLALATEEEFAKFKIALEKLGLIINNDKTTLADRGVFCEQFASMLYKTRRFSGKREYIAMTQSRTSINEVSGPRGSGEVVERGVLSCMRHCQQISHQKAVPAPIRSMAISTMQNLGRKHKIHANRQSDWFTIFGVLSGKPLRETISPRDKKVEQITRSLYQVASMANGTVPLNDVITSARTALNSNRRRFADPLGPIHMERNAKVTPPKALRRMYANAQKAGRRLNLSQAYGKISSKTLDVVIPLVNGLQLRSTKTRKIIRCLILCSRCSDTAHLQRQIMRELLINNYPMLPATSCARVLSSANISRPKNTQGEEVAWPWEWHAHI
jgi:hypothetical protein